MLYRKYVILWQICMTRRTTLRPRIELHHFALLVMFAALLAPAAAAAAVPISVVAAENFYGDVAQQIGGSAVAVRSILGNPAQDPHLFEASPSVARALATARLVIYNGLDYDPWMATLIGAAGSGNRKAIVVAELVGKSLGDNPHIWYAPRTMPALAAVLANDLGTADPANAAYFQQRLARFQQSMQPIDARIATLRARFAGMPVTATEPVFGYMLAALGMQVRNRRFQLAVMNDTEPSAADVAAFENDLRNRAVRLLVYNSQATEPLAARMVEIARASHIPVVAVTETEPPDMRYQAWMASALDAVDRALSK
jgi:zinc/manganese transport system substrate-binding protein